MSRERRTRVAALGAIAIAVALVLVLLATGGSSYTLYAQFQDAGQLVAGDLVTVAGHPVGSIGTPKLASDGLAVIPLQISDSSVAPLRVGTIATIGQLSLTGVSNRFVSLSPGMGAPLRSGSTLPLTQTRGIVDLDTVLDGLTPQVRSALQHVIKTGAYLMSGSTPQAFNQAITYLNPAFSQTSALGSELVSDRFALDRLVSSASSVATTLASRDADLSGAVANTATTLRDIASERTALEDTLSRAPAVLHQGTGVLRDTNYALGVLKPTLVDLRPVAPLLATLLEKTVPAANNALPTIEGVSRLIPGAERSLQELPGVVRTAVPSVNSLGAALPAATPIVSGLRPYAPEVASGFFDGIGGDNGGYYDANGHYMRVMIEVAPTGAAGLASLLNPILSQLPPFNGVRLHQLSPCPGGAVGPSPNGGNPWTNPDVLPSAGTICNPADDLP
jgi:phospholipid/cholesterol/gamma-HCH transport system substrate-binding protein